MIKDKYILGQRNDPGDPRRNNEDRTWVDLIYRANQEEALIVGVVADGVGSAEGAAGAQLAVDVVIKYIQESRGTNIPQIIADAVESANLAVFRENEKLDRNGLTTLVVAIIYNDRCFIGNVGDSRAYWVQNVSDGNGKMLLLTRDHSFYNIYGGVDQDSQEGGVLVNYIGKKPDVFVDLGFYLKGDDQEKARQLGVNGLPLKPGDSILLCSDGLIKKDRLGKRFAEDKEIISSLITESATDKAAIKMVSAAVGRRPDDNVSAVTIQYLSQDVIQRIESNKRREYFNSRIKQVYPLVGIFSVLAVTIAVVSVILNRNNKQVVVLPTYTPFPTFAVPNNIMVQGAGADSIGRMIFPNGKVEDLDPRMHVVFDGARVEVAQNGSNIHLADGTALYISNGTVFIFERFEGGGEITLQQGSIMVKLGPGAKTFTVRTTVGYSAQVSGSVMGVQYQPLSPGPGVYVDCFEGNCSIFGPITIPGMEGEDRYSFFAISGGMRINLTERCKYWNDAIGSDTVISLGAGCFEGNEISTPSLAPTYVPIEPTRDRGDGGGNPVVITPYP